jgi:hypothetical protein
LGTARRIAALFLEKKLGRVELGRCAEEVQGAPRHNAMDAMLFGKLN